jgi:hypothetical protein
MNRAMVLPLIFVVAVLAAGGVTVAWHPEISTATPIEHGRSTYAVTLLLPLVVVVTGSAI